MLTKFFGRNYRFSFIISLIVLDQETTQEPTPKKRKSIPKILDGRYYAIEKNEEGKIEAKYTTCNQMKKGNISSTGNFIAHFKSKHPAAFKELDEYLKNTRAEDGKNCLRQTFLTDINNPISNGMVCFRVLFKSNVVHIQWI